MSKEMSHQCRVKHTESENKSTNLKKLALSLQAGYMKTIIRHMYFKMLFSVLQYPTM